MVWSIVIPERPKPAPRGRHSSGPNKQGNRVYMPAAYRNAKTRIVEHINNNPPNTKLEGPVHLEVTFIFQIANPELWGHWRPHPGDIDNLLKTLMDAINNSGTIWNDDRQVVSTTARKLYGPTDQTHLTLWEVH